MGDKMKKITMIFMLFLAACSCQKEVIDCNVTVECVLVNYSRRVCDEGVRIERRETPMVVSVCDTGWMKHTLRWDDDRLLSDGWTEEQLPVLICNDEN